MNTDPAAWAARYTTIVLEGCDGTGKTTLANRLADQHGFTVVHSPRTPDGIDLAGRYRQILARPGRLVLDRSFVSELVYGPILHGRSRIGWNAATDLARAVADRDGVFIHFTAPTSTIIARLHARHPEAVPTTGLILQLRRAYDQVFTHIAAIAPVVTIDTAIGAQGHTAAPPSDTG